ncbi:MAG: RNA polymerase factor sigma-54 [Bacteroidaceae bacterium]|nr:RNA polymerase factor sigma-54 [Bacteroidaceae bacterium]MBR5276574.1 RNA polymerase factor sigma-54 [Bacteroidaceae bacterium]
MTKKSSIQKQVQTQTQTQTLSPQQVILARLLELTAVEIEDRVRSEIMDNPAIESVLPESVDHFEVPDMDADAMNETSAGDYRVEDDIPDYHGWDYHSTSSVAADIPTSADVSFGELLLEQLAELPLDDNEKRLGEYLIGSLEEDGLLYKALDEIVDELNIYNGIYTDEQQLLRILRMIQSFDPAGVGARSLQECLLLQIERMEPDDSRRLQQRIISEAYDEFSRKRWDLIPEKLGVGDEECKTAIAEIVKLNPRPGASLAESLGLSRQQIIPDFIVDVSGDDITIVSNSGILPELRVSNEYCAMLDAQTKSGSSESKAAALFLKQKIEAAKNFIGAVKQREQTLSATIEAVVDFQREFILSGGDESLLKPMILEDVARRSGYDISTVSRVSNSRYVQLPWGVFPLKYFFSDGVATSDGGEKSVRELYRCLQEFVDAEDKSMPLTDGELMDKLKEQGFTMARRTVAKYRESLNIPVARLRKE